MQTAAAYKNTFLERHAAFSQQVALQQSTNEDKAAGSSERGCIHYPIQLVPARICFFFLRTWGRHLNFFSPYLAVPHIQEQY